MTIQTPYVHHTGIVVPTEERVTQLMSLMGMEEAYRGYVPQWQALCIFAKATSGSPLEFVVADGGTLKTFNRGVGGIHHIALAVTDLDQVASELKKKGMHFLETEHVKGAGPFMCNFLSPVFTRGVPIEYVQEL